MFKISAIRELITIRKITDHEKAIQQSLQQLRTQIDMLDQSLLDGLGKRMKISDEIGKLKKDNNVAVLQNKRWNEILGRMILEGEDRNLGKEFVIKLFKAIHQESINHQEKILNA